MNQNLLVLHFVSSSYDPLQLTGFKTPSVYLFDLSDLNSCLYLCYCCFICIQIPNAHLEGVSIYNATHPEPVREVFKPGPGVNDTDVILYIVSKTTKLCVAQVSAEISAGW